MTAVVMLAAVLIIANCVGWLRAEERQRVLRRDDRLIDLLAQGVAPPVWHVVELEIAAMVREVRETRQVPDPRTDCIGTASCEEGNHTYTWPCDLALMPTDES